MIQRLADMRCPGVQQTMGIRAPRRVETMGQARPLIGETLERAAAEAIGARRLATQAGRWCPDLALAAGGCAEVKGVGPGSSVFLHRSQFEAIEQGRDDYHLIFIRHSAKLTPPLLERDAVHRIRLSILGMLVVPSTRLRGAVRARHIERLEDGRQGKRILRSQIERLWRSRNCHRWRVPLAEPSAVDRPLVECRGYRLALGDSWWPADLREAAVDMLAEMEQSRHTVVLTPAPQQRHHSHMVRTVIDEGPAWYRALCARSPMPCRSHWRKPSSTVKRCRVENYLRRVVDDLPLRLPTELALRPFIEQRADELASAEASWIK